jgi:tRNA A37 threonylcarbamoyladenosine synthetase subunit TsaC/SUA5/YrdC
VDIGGDGRTLGLRVPDHADLRALLRTTGPLATTSANRSGSPTPPTVDGVAGVFGSSVALYLDGGPAGTLRPSTVVSDVGERLTILREGPIPADALERAAGGIA